ncbi:MAG: hypothetical protein R2764_19515 [Bacteroidales bacterium]
MKKLFILILIAVTAQFIIACSPKTEQKKEAEQIENATVEVAAPNQLTQAEMDDGWVLLFDGNSTSEWRGYNLESFPEKGWVVEDGTLHVMGSGKGKPVVVVILSPKEIQKL